MDRTYWHKQTPDQPLFKDLLWSRPENKRLAGKLLIIGGHAQGFTAPATAYGEALKAGIGTCRVILPGSLFKTVSKIFPEAEYAPSTPSGSFNQQALAELCELAQWADGVLLAGDFGRNSETAILLEQFAGKYHGHLTVAGDSLDYFGAKSDAAERPQTLWVPGFQQLQKLGQAAHSRLPFTASMDFLHLVDALHNFTRETAVHIMLNHVDTIFTAVDGQVSTTKPATGKLAIKLAAHAATWWLQTPSQPFQALSSSLLD